MAWIQTGKLVISQPDGSSPMVVAVDDLQMKYSGVDIVGWTADGKTLLFTESCVGTCGASLYAVNSDGKNARRVFTNQTDARYLSIHPNSSSLITECWRSSPMDRNLCRSTLEEGGLVPTGLEGYDPAFSPDGTKIAWFASQPNFTGQDTQLVVLEDEQSQAEAAENLIGWYAEYVWLPDSRGLILKQNSEGDFCEIYRVVLGEAEPLLLARMENCYPTWRMLDQPSPSGDFIVYYYQNRAYIVDTHGENPPVLARAPQNAKLVWSPDGNLIALSLGKLAQWIDPKTGDASEITTDIPWRKISVLPLSIDYMYQSPHVQP